MKLLKKHTLKNMKLKLISTHWNSGFFNSSVRSVVSYSTILMLNLNQIISNGSDFEMPTTLQSIVLCLQLIRIFTRGSYFQGQGSVVLLKKAPSIRPLSFLSYEVNGSGALFARFGKKNQFQINS